MSWYGTVDRASGGRRPPSVPSPPARLRVDLQALIGVPDERKATVLRRYHRWLYSTLACSTKGTHQDPRRLYYTDDATGKIINRHCLSGAVLVYSSAAALQHQDSRVRLLNHAKAIQYHVLNRPKPEALQATTKKQQNQVSAIALTR